MSLQNILLGETGRLVDSGNHFRNSELSVSGWGFDSNYSKDEQSVLPTSLNYFTKPFQKRPICYRKESDQSFKILFSFYTTPLNQVTESKEQMVRIKVSLIIVLLVSIEVTRAQVPDVGNWFGVQLPVTINKKWELGSDATFRTVGISFTPYQYTLRTGARYFFNEKWSVSGGPAVFFTRATFSKTEDEFGTEFRLWQEGRYQPQIGKKIILQNRLRVEERFFTSVGTRPSFNALRFRYRLAATYAFNAKWSVEVGDEYMHHYLHSDFGFSQNRLGMNVFYNSNLETRFQLGYFWSYAGNLSQHWILLLFQKRIYLHGSHHHHS